MGTWHRLTISSAAAIWSSPYEHGGSQTAVVRPPERLQLGALEQRGASMMVVCLSAQRVLQAVRAQQGLPRAEPIPKQAPSSRDLPTVACFRAGVSQQACLLFVAPQVESPCEAPREQFAEIAAKASAGYPAVSGPAWSGTGQRRLRGPFRTRHKMQVSIDLQQEA